MNEAKLKFIYGCLWMAIGSMCLLAGCGQSKASLHEDDHEMPAHWPGSLEDAADKIERHFQELQNHPSQALDGNIVFEQFRDLVEWAPNIAGDEDLTEQDWNPIYQASEQVRLGLRSKFDSSRLQSAVQELCKLLRQSHQKVVAIQIANAIVDEDLPDLPGNSMTDVQGDQQMIDSQPSQSTAESP